VSKHELKRLLREGWARLLFHTGLHRVVDRLMPRRLTILFGHCVDAPALNGFLPPDMKIGREKLSSALRWFARRYELTTVGAGFAAVRGEARGKSLVALSMDDGYRDNRTELLPLLAEVGAPATVYLESRPLDERRVNWTHKYFWILQREEPAGFAARYAALAQDPTGVAAVEKAAGERKAVYAQKLALKYEVDPAERDRAIDRVFAELGGDDRALCDELYLTWDDARALLDAGIELGGHTVTHAIFSRLDGEAARREAGECARSLERGLPGWKPTTFAYPFGRKWDYDAGSMAAVSESGWPVAVNTHAGTNGPRSDPLQLRRIPIDDTSRLHVLVAEACGGFDLLRRIGLDLSE
jgi:peptidoglycan/xylan/chitin deacetylase (PgdA/CDA1 family)